MDKRSYPFKSLWSILAILIMAGIVALVVINFGFLWEHVEFLAAALMPFVLGFILAYILNLVVKFYEKYLTKTPRNPSPLVRGSAITLALATVLAFFSVVALLVIPQLVHSLTILVQAIPAVYQVAIVKLDAYLSLLPNHYKDIIVENINNTLGTINAKVIGNLVIAQLLASLKGLFNFVITFALAFIFSLFILFNKERLQKQIKHLGKAFLAPKVYEKAKYVLTICHETLANYIAGQFLDATILGVMVTLGLLIFGVEYPFSIGCAVGLLSLIPLLGAYLGGLMGVIMLLPLGSSQPLIFLIILIVIQQIESNLIYPRVVGGSIGLPGIWTFMAITLGGTLYGVLGMIISVPLAAIIYKLLRNEVNQRLTNKDIINKDWKR